MNEVLKLNDVINSLTIKELEQITYRAFQKRFPKSWPKRCMCNILLGGILQYFIGQKKEKAFYYKCVLRMASAFKHDRDAYVSQISLNCKIQTR